MHATIETDSASDTIGKAGDDDIIIRVEKLGKRYQLGRQTAGRSQYRTLRDALAEGTQRLFRRREKTADEDEFWALKDVSFEIRRGEVVGIIGRNGAGKSTLLKILSRITEPTTGKIRIAGRVASLLEVGTGFHPELTGRENIFLNGAILGMSHVEIKAKFDEIVAFAEVERFLDTPVKRYSSGMYVRLAFAVAAHLEPEILVVDEVLAVGDVEFQKKCLGKMQDVSRSGRTVLFVSHQMGAIAQLCPRSLLLVHGMVAKMGKTRDVIDAYLRHAADDNQGRYQAAIDPTKALAIVEARTLDQEGRATGNFSHKEPITVAITYVINRWVPGVEIGFSVHDQRGRKIFMSERLISREGWKTPGQRQTATAIVPAPLLMPGYFRFTFHIHVANLTAVDFAEDSLGIAVVDAGSGLARYGNLDTGCVVVDCAWSFSDVP